MSKKLKVLCWSDSPAVSTGFGVVSKNVIGALHKTGKYDIHHLAINHDGRFVDDKVCPWQLQPAKLLDPSDPYGNQMFINSIVKGDYDIIWILNDNYVTHGVSKTLGEVRAARAREGKKVPTIIYYYPVDCQVIPEGGGMLRHADILVAYTAHGRAETVKSMPDQAHKIREIPHGVDSKVFHPLSKKEAMRLRKKYLNVGPEKYVVTNINRNTSRKQIPYTFLAFKEFRKQVPDSLLYVHAAFHDQGGDLLLAARDLGFNLKEDVIFPVNYGPGNAVSEEALNGLYNAADMYLSTHLGEGWGLTISESMAAGTPVVVPNNTCMPQLVGKEEERGYLYDCKDVIWIDNSGYRVKGFLDDIVGKMMEAYNDGSKWTSEKVKLARAWAEEHDWNNVCKQWVKLFDEIGEAGPLSLVQEVKKEDEGVGEVI